MNLKCRFSALEQALLSIENKLIIFNLTIFNYGVSIISFLINPKSPFFSLFCPFPPQPVLLENPYI